MNKRFGILWQLLPIKVVAEVVLTTLLIVTGILGLALSFVNPIQWITVRVPEWAHPSLASLDSLILSLNTNLIPVLATSSVIILLGLIQPNTRRGFKSIPSKVLNAYRKVCAWRDWLFAKIEYLNGESAKWRRFFNVMKSPYSLLRAFGLNPQMAVGLLAAGSVTGTAVAVNEIVVERSFANGSPGIYAAPSEFPSEDLEKKYAWRKDNPDDNTLRIVLGTTPVEQINISNVSIGTAYTGSVLPSGKTEAILIEGKAGTTARLEIGELIFNRNTCKTLALSDINAHKISIKDNIADGLSIAQTLTSTLRNLRVSGGNFMADELKTEGGTYDRIWLDTGDLSSGKAKINKLNLSNIVSTGGSCIIRQADIGELTIQYSQVGHDQNFATKELTISSTVRAANWDVTGNYEVLLTEPTPPGQVNP